MAPLPNVVDPHRQHDQLPQPFRMLDKLVGELIESSLKEIDRREEERASRAQWEYDTGFAPKGMLSQSGDFTACFLMPDGARLIGGNKHGKLLAAQANDCSVEAECQAFEAPIIAVSGFNTPTILGADREAGRSVLLLAACTRKEVRLYKLHCAESEAASGVGADAADGAAAATAEGSLELLGKAMLPTGKDTHAVLGNLEFSPCGKVLMFTGGSGAASMYAVPADINKPMPTDMESLLWLSEETARDALHIVPSLPLRTCNAVWKLADKTKYGNVRDSKGVYLWWSGHNRLLLVPLAKQTVLHAALPPAPVAAGATPLAPGQSPSPPARREAPPLDKHGDWMSPAAITAVVSKPDGSTLALGLANGTVVLYSNATQTPREVMSVCSSAHAVIALSFLRPGRGHDAEQLVAATQVPDLRVVNLVELKAAREPIKLQASAFQVFPALHMPLILVMLANRRVIVVNTFTGLTAAELRLSGSEQSLCSVGMEVAFKAEAPPDASGASPGLVEVQDRERLPAPAFVARAGSVATALVVGTSAPPPRAPLTAEGGKEGAADAAGGREPASEGVPAPEDPGECIEEEEAAEVPAGKAPAKPAKVDKNAPPAEPAKPRRFLYVTGMPSLAVFDLQSINSELAPEDEDTMGGNPMMIHRMLAEPLMEWPGEGLPEDPAMQSGSGTGSRPGVRPVSKHAQFARGVTPQVGVRNGASRDGAGTAHHTLAATMSGTSRTNPTQDYEPSEVGTGVSGATAAAGDGVGVRIVKPVPGASSAVAERVLGKLGEAGGRRARNRVIRKTMRELSDKMLHEAGGQRPFLAPSA